MCVLVIVLDHGDVFFSLSLLGLERIWETWVVLVIDLAASLYLTTSYRAMALPTCVAEKKTYMPFLRDTSTMQTSTGERWECKQRKIATSPHTVSLYKETLTYF